MDSLSHTSTRRVQDWIDQCAAQTQRPAEEVKVVYEQQLEYLQARASVLVYIHIFAQRKTREVLTATR